MLRFLIGGFVIAHGLVTIAIWSPNPKSVESAPPIDTSRSLNRPGISGGS